MANVKVRDLATTQNITNDNKLMVLTDENSNQVKNITVENFIDDINSSDTDNGITIGTDGKLYVDNPDTGVTAGTYAFPQNLEVDSKGRITGVVNGTPAPVSIATSSSVGVVKPDNDTIIVDGTGTISCKQNNGYQLFDIVMKDHVLDYAETLGFAPLGTYVYKEAIAGSRYGYPDFYQKCLDEYNDGTPSYLSSNITIVGSLTDNEGVISGFSTSNYATIGNFIGTTADTIEFVVKLNTGSSLSSNSFLYAGFNIQFYNGKLNMPGRGDIGTYSYSANTDYYIKVTYSNNTIECAYSTDGISYTADGTISYTGAIQNLIYLGWGNANNALLGSIDLNECYVNINGTRWWTGTNECIQSSNKHRFYDIDDKATFDNMYAITGEAWCYGIDTTNERIFLPRSTRFKNGTTSDVGGYQPAGLPNITGDTGFIKWGVAQGTDGAITTSLASHNKAPTSDGSTWAESYFAFNASDSNSIYGASDTVEYSSTKLIPYMVVGNQSTWAGMTDVVNNGLEILQEVNEGLETKLDADTIHIIDSYENGSSSYIVYSNGYCEQRGTSVFSGVNAKQIDIAFLKEFRDTDYVMLPSIGANTNYNTFNFISYYNKTTSAVKIVINNLNGQAAQIVGCDWEASGYLAEGEY